MGRCPERSAAVRNIVGTAAPQSGDRQVSPHGHEFQFDTLVGKDALIDVFEMRRLVEPSIAALAAERATPADILRLKEICIAQEQQIKRGTSAVESDATFHLTIGQATHNTALQRLVASIVELLKPMREQSLQTPGRAHKSLASHREILVAIERHDPELARQAMQRHIEAVEHNVLR